MPQDQTVANLLKSHSVYTLRASLIINLTQSQTLGLQKGFLLTVNKAVFQRPRERKHSKCGLEQTQYKTRMKRNNFANNKVDFFFFKSMYLTQGLLHALKSLDRWRWPPVVDTLRLHLHSAGVTGVSHHTQFYKVPRGLKPGLCKVGKHCIN